MPKRNVEPLGQDRPHRPAPTLSDQVPSLPTTARDIIREIHDRTTEWELIAPSKDTVPLKDWPNRLLVVLAYHAVDDEMRLAPSVAQVQRPRSSDESVEIRQLAIYTEELEGWSLALDRVLGDTELGARLVKTRSENLKKIYSAIVGAAQYASVRKTLFLELRAEHTILEDLTSRLMEHDDSEQRAALKEGREAKRLSETFRMDVAPRLTHEQEAQWERRVETPQPTTEERPKWSIMGDSD